jgi:putative hydrolase of the HAD superfamily
LAIKTKTKGIRAIVFDLDRTLIKSQRGSDKALLEVADFFLKRYGNIVSRGKINRTLRPLAKSLESQGLYNRDEWWIKLSRRLGLSDLSWNHARKITLLYWRTYVAASIPYQDAGYTLKTLRKRRYRLALVTDTDGTPGMKRKRVRTLPFFDLFETVVVAGEDTLKIKPSKAPFILVAKRLRLPPRRCIYVGDNPKVDVRGAEAVGMRTILVKRRRMKGDRPSVVIESLRQLLRIFKGAAG